MRTKRVNRLAAELEEASTRAVECLTDLKRPRVRNYNGPNRQKRVDRPLAVRLVVPLYNRIILEKLCADQEVPMSEYICALVVRHTNEAAGLMSVIGRRTL